MKTARQNVIMTGPVYSGLVRLVITVAKLLAQRLRLRYSCERSPEGRMRHGLEVDVTEGQSSRYPGNYWQ